MNRCTAFFHQLTSILVLLLLLAGCVSHSQNRKKEAEAMRNLGEAYFVEGSYYRAYEEFKRAERMAPSDPQLHDDLGLTYLALNKPELAAQHFRKAVSLDPDYTRAKNNLASALMALDDWNGAIEILLPLSEDLGYGATKHYAYSNLAWAYYNLKEQDKALYYCERALRLASNYLPALRTQAAVYMDMGDSQKAFKTVDTILRINPQDATAWMQKGELFEKMYEFDTAIVAYSQAKRIGKDTDIEIKAEAAINRLRH